MTSVIVVVEGELLRNYHIFTIIEMTDCRILNAFLYLRGECAFLDFHFILLTLLAGE